MTQQAPGSPCDDCHTDTTPCTHKRGCRHGRQWEWYMVNDDIWNAAGPARYLCIGCLERRIGRPLTATDFKDVPLTEPHPWDTDRLADRKADLAA